MKNDFKNIFKEEMPVWTILFEFNTIRKYLNNGQYYCFVEDKNDAFFYRRTGNNILKQAEFSVGVRDKYKYINDDPRNDYNIRHMSNGKDRVINTFIKIDRDLHSQLSKCIFLVDKDFEGAYSFKYTLTDEQRNRITTTAPFYSFENYFLENNNLKKIFKKIGIEEEYLVFDKLLKKFISEISDYTKLKYVATMSHMKSSKFNDRSFHYSKIYSSEQIFSFNFNDDPFYYKERMLEEITLMQIALNNSNGKSKKYYESLKKHSNTSRDIRGHDIYAFLEKYLKQKKGIDIHQNRNNKMYKDIIKILSVPITIKDGTGRILN